MSEGIVIEGGDGNIMSNNTFAGLDTAIRITDGSGNRINNNLILSEKALRIYGSDFLDVFNRVSASEDRDAIVALAIIQESEPDNEKVANAWATVIKTCGAALGSFSISTLSNVLSIPAYTALKALLAPRGIQLP
jgi:hypothetical protein